MAPRVEAGFGLPYFFAKVRFGSENPNQNKVLDFHLVSNRFSPFLLALVCWMGSWMGRKALETKRGATRIEYSG
jgi:hypothetical protein